jgi:hypothetical protein
MEWNIREHREDLKGTEKFYEKKHKVKGKMG